MHNLKTVMSLTSSLQQCRERRRRYDDVTCASISNTSARYKERNEEILQSHALPVIIYAFLLNFNQIHCKNEYALSNQ